METIKLKDKTTLEIVVDNDPLNPREWDNLSRMICFHNKYDLGDKHDYDTDEYDGWEEMESGIIHNEKPIVILPLYLYDHSGITISTEPFSCRWDSGQVGFVYVNNKSVDLIGCTIQNDETLKEYKARLKKSIMNEVNVYDLYIRGEVYGFNILDEDEEVIDSCSGFYGYDWKSNGMADHIDKDLLSSL
jgi:hypothetical protein